MSILQRLFSIVLLVFLANTLLFATGPSSIQSQIRPISINEKGEVLCRTRFTQNGMGAHDFMDIEYGFCVLTKDSIIEFQTIVLSPKEYQEDYTTLMEHRAGLDSIFISPFIPDNLNDMEKSLQNTYGFTESNVAPYEKNKTFTLQEFRKEKKLDLEKVHQKALHGAKGIFSYIEDKRVVVAYDFGDIMLISNEMDKEEYDLYRGAEFNYPNPYFPKPEGDTTEFGLYENCTITGVVFVKP